MKAIKIEIRDFKLSYDGMFNIILSNGSTIPACIQIDVILKIFRDEGYSIDEISSIIKNSPCDPFEFKKATLIIDGYEEDNGKISYRISDLSNMHKLKHGRALIDFKIKESTI